ncbi:heavy metal-responsive transcriptional regulator [Aestuariibacter sp. AA17]|uniref:Heavy metal-responsive transcriptional regulator n=1 Tax=Fluctibacter corallii TaxID=2984329 RepID=A0ABT3A3V6_9ALTE|nr:heavy metal-responsive transcriptional regulator [Aestuariibacter sp. AA17]MCV2883368.1 heavy metal-responsive transcriptional regulator [Aestuariibacter sp. AA17]
MKIGDLARKTGLSVHTLRYYEKAGLLQASGRTGANYRIYTEDDATTASFIKRCKECGFTLDETRALITIRDDKRQHVCAEAKDIAQNKMQDLKTQITSLQAMLITLDKLQALCCGGEESAEFCSIIANLEGAPS